MRKLKILICTVLTFFTVSSVFALGSYKVESFTGKVTYESAPGKWTAVKVGQELPLTTVIQTSVNSNLVLSNDGSKVTVKAMQKGTVESLTAVASTSGIKKGSALTDSAVAASTESSKSVVTASSRASEAKEDLEWDE